MHSTTTLAHATAGSTAQPLPSANLALAAESSPSRHRTPLSVVASLPGRRRAPVVVFCFLALVAAMAAVLVLNIAVSSGQYELVQLNSTKSTLAKQNEVLTQQVQNVQAPQNLAQKAQQLGMVVANSTGQINVNTQTISGSPKPAIKLANPVPLIAAPETGETTPVNTAKATTPQQSANPLASGTAASDFPFRSHYAGPSAKPTTSAKPAQPNLHGGSIPSPEQKTPNPN